MLTLDTFTIWSASGFCCSLSWSRTSCGKGGSLLEAGPANMVAASQPPAAASVSDESQIDVAGMFPPGVFLIEPEDASRGATPAPAFARSDRADIVQAGLRQVHAVGDVARLLAIHVEREHHPRLALLGPADHPAERSLFAAE